MQIVTFLSAVWYRNIICRNDSKWFKLLLHVPWLGAVGAKYSLALCCTILCLAKS